MRVRVVTMDGESQKIAPLSYDEAEQYIKDNQAMRNRDPKPTPDEWAMRTLESVCFALNKATGASNGNSWTPQKLTKELDMIYIQHLHTEFMEMSGVRLVTPGGSTGDIDFKLIRCRMVTELKKSPEEVGSWDFPFVMELLEYWADCPPSHLLLRAMTHYEGKKKEGNWRKQRAMEIGDETYKPEQTNATGSVTFDQTIKRELPIAETQANREALRSFHGARHTDCAPGHVQQAIARAKRGEHLNVPQ